MNETNAISYPLLSGHLAMMGRSHQAIYFTRDYAAVFGMSMRTVQTYIKNGKIIPRDFRGRACFLPCDLEEQLSRQRKVQ
ncbi:MAG TPA: hypothetical protein VN682_19895 [Terriglobales bacterium]|nr:hypothetical protein [Terriglobales bacterium]